MSQTSGNDVQTWVPEVVGSPVSPAPAAGNGSDEHSLMTIGSMATMCGVTVRALRYYEEMDLIGPVKRTAGKYRLYSQQTMKRVKAICALQALGYSLETIAAMLGPFSQSVGLSKGEQIDRSRQFLESQKACITEKMWELQTMLSEIDQRLGCLNSACVECLQHKPLDPCEEHCEDRQVHLN